MSERAELPIPEVRLPADILALGTVRGNEYAWPRTELPRVFDAARDASLATLGGQVQFRLAGATCELYWQSFDVLDRQPGEAWTEFVARAWAEVAVALARIPPDDALIAEGLKQFDFLRQQAGDGVDVGASLCFVCYFAAE